MIIITVMNLSILFLIKQLGISSERKWIYIGYFYNIRLNKKSVFWFFDKKYGYRQLNMRQLG